METRETSSIEAKPQRRLPARLAASYIFGKYLVFVLCGLLVLAIVGFIVRKNPDPGTRVWILNHTPDQVVIINPFVAIKEKEFLVADGLRELAFSGDYTKAYVANVVDISNRLTVIDTKTYLQEEEIVVDGVPQGIGVFPDNRKLAIILGSKTDFMAGGFDVIDLDQQSKADPKRKKRLYRERGLILTHKIAVGDDGDRIYCIDAKSSELTVYSLAQKRRVGTVDLHGAPEQLYYPRQGDYYYASVLVHQAIYQISKKTDTVEAAYIYQVPQPGNPFNMGRLRYLCVDSKARYLYATNYEQESVGVWDINNLNYSKLWTELPPAKTEGYRAQVMHFLPWKTFKLTGGLNPNLKYIPGGQQIAIDPRDEYVFVMDDSGGFWIYDVPAIMRCADGETLKPRGSYFFAGDVEVRDLKVSQPGLSIKGLGKR